MNVEKPIDNKNYFIILNYKFLFVFLIFICWKHFLFYKKLILFIIIFLNLRIWIFFFCKRKTQNKTQIHKKKHKFLISQRSSRALECDSRRVGSGNEPKLNAIIVDERMSFKIKCSNRWWLRDIFKRGQSNLRINGIIVQISQIAQIACSSQLFGDGQIWF